MSSQLDKLFISRGSSLLGRKIRKGFEEIGGIELHS